MSFEINVNVNGVSGTSTHWSVTTWHSKKKKKKKKRTALNFAHLYHETRNIFTRLPITIFITLPITIFITLLSSFLSPNVSKLTAHWNEEMASKNSPIYISCCKLHLLKCTYGCQISVDAYIMSLLVMLYIFTVLTN